MGRTGAHRAERAAPAADRSNLIRVMPAQGGALRDSTAQSFDVAVAGGGVIGLAVAWRAAQAGADVVVLHASRDGAAWPVVRRHACAGRRGAVRPRRAACASAWRARAAGRTSPTRSPPRPGATPATCAAARSSSRATATRPRRSSASSPIAPSATCPSSACCPPRPAASSPRWARACAWPSTSPATTRSTPARCATRWPRPSAAPAASCARARRWRTSPSCARWPRARSIAVGAWAGALAGVPVRPVKGQILRLRDPSGPGLVDRVLRLAESYLVPRGDGRYVLGATVEERGFDTALTAGGVFELLRDAYEVVPGLAELELEEASVGLRPATPDNGPLLGPADARRRRARRRSLPQRHPARRRSPPTPWRRCSPATIRPPSPRPFAARYRFATAVAPRDHHQRQAPRHRPRHHRGRPAGRARRGALRPPWHRRGHRRRGRAARPSGRPPRSATARRSRSSSRSREADRADRRRHLRLAPDPRHRRLHQPRRARDGHPGHRHRARHGRPAPRLARRARLDHGRARAGGRAPAAQHRRLLHRPRRGHHGPARARRVRDRLGQARGHRRRPHPAARRAAARSRRPRSSWPTASSSCPTPTTTPCSPAGWRRSAARRSCRWARPSARAWASATRTTSRSSASRPSCR